MFVLRKWFLAKKKSCKCLKPCQRRKGSAGRRCGCSGCNPGLAGSPSVPLRFQPAPRAPEQRAGVRTRPGRSSQTHTGRPNRTFFAATSPNVRELRVINGRFQAKSQDDSLFPISQVSASSAWARDSETLLTPDCAAAGRAGASYEKLSTSYHKLSTRSCRHQSTIYRTVTSGFPLPCHSGSLSSSTSDRGNRMGIPPIWID